MTLSFEPLRVNSLKDTCIARLEELILSGELQASQRLPAERNLAVRLGVSRPVLHEALVDLAAKGLVSILPRRGVVINDYRKSGSTAILSSLLAYHQGNLEPRFVDSLFEWRILIETETARLAAGRAAPADLQHMQERVAAELSIDRRDLQFLTTQDFEFHLLVAVASGNLVYPLVINSFKNVYTHFTREFFHRAQNSPVIDEVFTFHTRLVEAVTARQPQQAAEIMSAMLIHGEQFLKGATIPGNNPHPPPSLASPEPCEHPWGAPSPGGW